MRYVSLIFFATLYSMYIRTITILRSKLKFNRSFKSATTYYKTHLQGSRKLQLHMEKRFSVSFCENSNDP